MHQHCQAILATLSPLLLAAGGTSQQPTDVSAAPRSPLAKLQSQLQAAADEGGWTFDAEWHWSGSEQPLPGKESPRRLARKVSGAYRGDRLHVRYDREPAVELLRVGDQSIVRQGDGEWRRTKADGDPALAYVPDIQQLLRLLATFELQIADTSFTDREGIVVELVAVTLLPEQVDRLVHAGVLMDPNPLPVGLREMMVRYGVDQALIETPMVDVAIESEIRTRTLRRLTVRSLVRPTDTARIRQLLAGGRPAPAGAVEPAEARKGEAHAAPTATEKPEYQDGLPVRADARLRERRIEFRLQERTELPQLQLDAAQQRLLDGDR